ncbi:MAG TPA: hypothetical protein PKK17_03745 [Sphingorhabdus lacus]|nr:hypothetical protein [Sphingorhabdus lacus]HPV67448.1 hypothetical protein [Sphingorhabdus lacus]
MKKEKDNAALFSDFHFTQSVGAACPICIAGVGWLPGMTDLSTLRLHFLRVNYALIAFAMGSMIWPEILTHSGNWALMPGVVKCMLGSLSLLALLGIRYPLKMLPLLFWEMGWKTIWLLAVALPQWQAGTLDEATSQTVFETGLVVIIYAAMPWRYVLEQFVLVKGDRWSFRNPG